ncbi:hypothetical protein [Deinococcus arenicola]|uniref:Lipoprotein n=1 Tax=Deinococcus arenicola TaxID=2994950 RepID=A0ABU4DTA2_9DEIO|nr:hypothetical protein [Deinococcus sp. ZS9-10]MDV6375668.1 hypothetical protein [Deinococcus sp. ZS9-10]
MRISQKRTLQAVGGSVMLLTLLTACPRPYPPFVPPVNLNFTFPDTAADARLTLAAISFGTGNALNVLSSRDVGGFGGTVNQGMLSLEANVLADLQKNPACLTSFKDGEARGLSAVVVTPETVKTCNVYFTLFRDTNGNGKPESTEEVFNTHDIYSYADTPFTYSFASTDGKSVENGKRVAGWSLVRHEVLQTSVTAAQYRVTMNSIPTADEALPIYLHENTDRLISMGLEGLK